ncbi:MAG: Hsp70 family protein [Spirochaetes bacterium]|nr:Hsp70 family protein [Spirochaetota bacterium]
MRPIIGIDFGTTNSLVAWIDDGRPVVIPNDRGARITPSVVAFPRSGDVLVGESARNQAVVEPERTVVAIKRMLGGADRITMDGKAMGPEEIASHIFRKLKHDAESYLGTEIREAVITVPARYPDVKRRSIREASCIAGLAVRRLVNEPTAAAVARAYLEREPTGRKTLLVYDFGGGTFDVTVLAAEGRKCRVLSTAGDEWLGGIDIDAVLLSDVEATFRSGHGIDIGADRRLSQSLADLVERAKIELSSRNRAAISIPFASSGHGGIAHLEYVVDRDRFEEMASPFVDRTIALVRQAIRDAGLSPADIDSLVLSGGSSRIPLVAERLAGVVDLKPEARVNFEEIVAIGAAVEAAVSSGSLKGFFVSDVATRSYGVEIDGGGFVPVVPRHETLPTRHRKLFSTVADGQESVEISILQGESSRASGNEPLGRFMLTGIRKAKRGEPRIMVEFNIDESDILSVRAVDLDTGVRQGVVVAGEGSGTGDSLEALAERIRGLAARGPVDGPFREEIEETLAEADRLLESSVDELATHDIRSALEAIVGELLAMER